MKYLYVLAVLFLLSITNVSALNGLVINSTQTIVMGGNFTFDYVFVDYNATLKANNSIGYLNISAIQNITIYGSVTADNEFSSPSPAAGNIGGTATNVGQASGGGGGGGSAANGGNGGSATTSGSTASGGNGGGTISLVNDYNIVSGSNGGSGGSNGGTGGTGGFGGAGIKLFSPYIFINGSIIAGAAGGNSGSGGGGAGGGGGSGGTLLILGNTLILNGSTITASGGNGGSGSCGSSGNRAAGGGGGGSAGQVKIFYQSSIQNGSSVVSSTGGTGGTKCTLGVGESANNGANGGTTTANTSQVSDLVFNTITFISPTDANNSNLSRNYILVNVTATSLTFSNVTVNLYNSLRVLINSTFNSIVPYYLNITGLSDGTYYLNASSIDASLNMNQTETRTLNIDTVAPNVTIITPLNATSYSVNVTSFNFSIQDAHIAFCWYSVNLTTNVSTSCTTNVTINSTYGYNNWTIYANDTFGNVNSSMTVFFVDPTTITVNNIFPARNQYLNKNVFNLSCSVTGASNGALFIYGNFSGIYNLNATNLTTVSGVAWNNSMSLPDSVYSYSCAANKTTINTITWDTFGNSTFTVDTVNPVINNIVATTTAGTQTFSFTSNVSDTNLFTCKYSIINSTGGIDGTNQNVSFTCNSPSSATTTMYGTFNFTVLVTDLASNFALSTQSITTSPSSGGTTTGGGGGGSTDTTIPVIGLNKIVTNTYSSLDREVYYAKINTQCSISLGFGATAVRDYSETCRLSTSQLQTVFDEILKTGTKANLVDLNSFNNNYIKRDLFQGQETQDTINKYGLFTSVLGLTTILQIYPSSSIDQPFVISISNKSSYVLTYVLTANKPLASCDVVIGNPNFKCIVKNTTLLLTYNINNTDFLSQIFQGTANVLTDAPSDKVERQTITFTARVYNFGYEITDGFPFYALFIIIVIVALLLIWYFFKGRLSRFFT